MGERRLLEALHDGGGIRSHVWPTTALAIADGQTRALSLAARIAAAAPEELPLAVAGSLHARIVTPAEEAVIAAADEGNTRLRLPTAWHGPVTFPRPGEPFTPAESARAHRLAELAESWLISKLPALSQLETGLEIVKGALGPPKQGLSPVSGIRCLAARTASWENAQGRRHPQRSTESPEHGRHHDKEPDGR